MSKKSAQVLRKGVPNNVPMEDQAQTCWRCHEKSCSQSHTVA
ncbi:hypothetical protein SLEP1_g52431 [Rubroshorea leprosula]|uniref:Uncharacterized protein n=1 Tax=Rubroshorea leprosula TaxID=152421 RepID=A0AAV5M8W2_9ROSI|nr:hypothetical protein SLEP1_g52431 [Rubroshorea leprosula]